VLTYIIRLKMTLHGAMRYHLYNMVITLPHAGSISSISITRTRKRLGMRSSSRC
jgi:hypothetical protein